ncbi:MAG: signal peptidase I [Chloroflexota bacterium]
MKALIRDIVTTAITAFVIFFLLQSTIQTSIVVGSSMEPTVYPQERLIVNKAAYVFGKPARGDIIVFHPPASLQLDYIKRVIALPGDTVEVKDGVVYVNGERLDEPYIKDAPNYTLHVRAVSEDNYFVLGDNRNNSNDSHTGWTIPSQSIIGKAWLRIWPLHNWGIISNTPADDQMAYSY